METEEHTSVQTYNIADRIISVVCASFALLAFSYIAIKVSFFRKRLEIIYNVFLLIVVPVPIFYIAVSFRMGVEEGIYPSCPNCVLSNLFFLAVHALCLRTLFTNFYFSMAYSIITAYGIHFIVIQNTYLMFYLDVFRLTISVLIISVWIYLREKSTREIFLKLFQACEDERRWNSIVMNLSDGVIALDESLKPIYWNNTAKTLHGLNEAKQNMDQDSILKKFEDFKSIRYLGDPGILAKVLRTYYGRSSTSEVNSFPSSIYLLILARNRSAET
jgi:PAS domain-containing protein